MDDQKIICKACDLVVSLPKFKKGIRCTCPQCANTLRHSYEGRIKNVAVVAVAALIIMAMTIFQPFFTISSLGLNEEVKLISIFYVLKSEWSILLISFLVFTFFFPISMLYLIICSGIFHYKPSVAACKIYALCNRFCFIDVFVLGVLVSLIKLTSLTDVHFHTGFFLLFVFSFLTIYCSTRISPKVYWDLVKMPNLVTLKVGKRAIDQGYMQCYDCGFYYDGKKDNTCPRCGKRNSFRFSYSVQKTTALLAAAILLYIPSNVFPIMFTEYLGIKTGSNIIDGVIALWELDSYFVALVILLASIFIPILKIISLSVILLTIKYAKNIDKLKLSRIFRLVSLIGKWSMIDVFVVVIMTVSVRITGLIIIDPGFAIVIFCAVVIITMFAAEEFDERIIWDQK